MEARGRALGLCLLAGVVGLVAVVTLAQTLAASAQLRATSPSRKAESSVRAGKTVTLSPHLGYGLNVRDPAHLDALFAPLSFEWVKLYEQYDALPKERLPYKVLYRVQLDGPPADLGAWGDHVEAIARSGWGLVEAYEVGNEPNQSWQWGNQVPDPDEYVTALRVAYARIEAADPDAIVVSGGLGPVGRVQATPDGEGWPGNNGTSMDEWEYTRAMFSQCITGCFDVFGYHPFGFAYAPEITPSSVSNNFAFRGAEDLHHIMLDYGLGEVPMWATEFGWIRDPDADGYGWCKLRPEFNEPFGWMLVSELEQADYLSRAFAYADAHWPWMEAMFVWNLDWNDQGGWDCSDIRFFSLLYVQGDATPAYDALAAMDKHPGPAGCRLLAEPTALVYLTDVDQPALITASVGLGGLAGCDGVTWTVTLAPSSTLRPTLPVTQGRLGQSLTFTVDSGAYVISGTDTVLLYPTGTYTALLTLRAESQDEAFSTTPSDVIGSPGTVQVRLIVAAEVFGVYLPVITKDL
jgi:hypothetical protein